MADFNFRITKVRGASRYRAGRYAVFNQMFDQQTRATADPAALTLAVQQRWRAKATRLREAGWRHAEESKLQYLRNCPPFGVVTDTTSRPCNRPQVCPFCFARSYALESFLAVERMLYGSTDPKAVLRRPCALVEYHVVNRLADADYSFDRLLEIVRAYYGVADDPDEEVARHTDPEVRDIPNWGGVRLRFINARPGTLLLGRRGLLVISADAPDPVLTAPNLTYRVHREVTKKALSEAIGRVARYPYGLWRHSTEERHVALLDSLAGVKMLSKYGSARGRGERF